MKTGEKRIIMMVLISYDVSTTSPAGKKRLRKVAKECQNHAQRVQNSVFEADLDYSSFLKLKEKLIDLIDKEEDSLRFYYSPYLFWIFTYFSPLLFTLPSY